MKYVFITKRSALVYIKDFVCVCVWSKWAVSVVALASSEPLRLTVTLPPPCAPVGPDGSGNLSQSGRPFSPSPLLGSVSLEPDLL